MDKDLRIAFSLIGLLFVGLFGSIILLVIDNVFSPTKDEMCQDIGQKSYKYIMNAQYCIDYNNDAHFVDFNCEGYAWNKICTTDIISIGDVRVR